MGENWIHHSSSDIVQFKMLGVGESTAQTCPCELAAMTPPSHPPAMQAGFATSLCKALAGNPEAAGR